MRAAGILFLLCAPLAADVILLKDGGRYSGKVVDKKSHYEVTTDGGGLRTFLKDEVAKVITNPKEMTADADPLFDQAKADFQAALAIAGPSEQNARLKDAIAKVTRAREAYGAARDAFPEDKYAELDQKLMQIMQLMRLLRDRLGSELARGGIINPGGRGGAPAASLQDAFSILKDPVKRGDYVNRATAREAFRSQRANHPEIYEVATAAMLFLSRSDTEWRLEGPALKALQEYFAQPFMKDPFALSPVAHQQAVNYVLQQIASLQKADAKANPEPLSLFGVGHVGHAPIGPETDKAARLLGLMVKNGVAGTPEGHVVRDLNSWISNGDFDLAVLAWVKEFRDIDTPVVRFVWSWALMNLVLQKKRGFDRPVTALQQIKTPEAGFREHVAALVKSIKEAAPCNPCAGDGKFRCTNCHGAKETRFNCEKCKGAGKVADDLGYLNPCYPCRGRGFMKLLKCEKCKDGTLTCKQCQGKSKTPPELEAVCRMSPCGQCDARGYVFRKILWACKSCMGVGQKLVPAADPSKALP